MLTRRETGLVPVRNAFDLALDRVFQDVFEGFPRWDLTTWTPRSFPAVNAWEDEKAFHVEAELPGMEEKDIQITVLGNELRLEGKREEVHDESARVQHRERFNGEFSRTLRFPVEIDDSKVEARFRNGLLTVTMPKAAAALPRKIEVKG
ncbi:MAG TPA: Hsp20/alpha crystallin family protein [Vicinamibacteria bacterium]|jgi:HSP20 family protein